MVKLNIQVSSWINISKDLKIENINNHCLLFILILLSPTLPFISCTAGKPDLLPSKIVSYIEGFMC